MSNDNHNLADIFSKQKETMTRPFIGHDCCRPSNEIHPLVHCKLSPVITEIYYRSSTMGTPGSIMSPVWTMDNIMEKRSDSDRASIYSRSSGSASEYSVPRGSCLLDKSFESSKRGSPVACCTPTVPAKTGGNCQCWQQKPCCCRKKSFSGPYENYDVPKTPMPLIQVRN